jgi:hypothetical protein
MLKRPKNKAISVAISILYIRAASSIEGRGERCPRE